MGIKFLRKPSNDENAIIGYSDSDFAGDRESSKSTTGFVVLFNGAPFHWKTKLQDHVTLSSTEAEVIALCTLSKELSWINRMASELRLGNDDAALIKCDNTSAMKIVGSVKMTGRTRHLRAMNAYIFEQINFGELKVQHVKSENQVADLLTKIVQTKKFIMNRDLLLTSVTNDCAVKLVRIKG